MYEKFKQYKESTIYSMSNLELLLLLYDEAVKRLKMAQIALEDKKYETFEECLERTGRIVRYLIQILDMQYPISKDLKRIYEYLIYDISRVKAGRERRAEEIPRISHILSELRDAFNQVFSVKGEYMSADLETILIYLQRRYNILREVCSLTEELAEAVERGDTVSASLLLDMRGEQLQRHADCEEQIILQTAGNSLRDRYLRDLAKGPLMNVKSCFKGKTEREKMLEKRIEDLRCRTEKLLDKIRRIDGGLNRRISKNR